jgi:hypothetical protein
VTAAAARASDVLPIPALAGDQDRGVDVEQPREASQLGVAAQEGACSRRLAPAGESGAWWAMGIGTG